MLGSYPNGREKDSKIRTKEETENVLIDLQFLGIDNVLVLRGDARHADSGFIPTPGGHAYATELLQQVVDFVCFYCIRIP